MTSLMLKPQLLRADTIDLQSQQNPSAKDHSRGQFQSGYSHAGLGSPGTHHVQALRNANQEASFERQYSPRVAGFDHSHLTPQDQSHMYDDEDEDDEDHSHNGINGVSHRHVYDDDDGEGDGNDSQDEDLDDELLDKISSSPSIEDGKPPWPARADSLGNGHTQRPCPAAPTRGISFSIMEHPQCNSVDTTPSVALVFPRSHQSDQSSPSKKRRIDFNSIPSLPRTSSHNGGIALVVPFGITLSNSIEDIGRHLLPLDDPFLDTNQDEGFEELEFDDQDPDWVDAEFDGDMESSDDDCQDQMPFDTDSRFIDSGWGGECLRYLEDIDFEFVYALHTFVATVEGQANATKGDTMVLLDDSNSYWWLVRVVKDGSIGYLPAEHIETPTERLARLNKHRNIDLAAAMLGDNPEKSKNPLKKAMRRRNAKTVNFAPPTYYEPEDVDWSDEEDIEGEDGPMAEMENTSHEAQEAAQQQSQQTQQGQQIQQRQQGDQTSQLQMAQPSSATIHRVESDESMDDEPSSPTKGNSLTPAPLQTPAQDNLQRTRKGVVRNADSFLKDDTETRKISLTPRLLRGDNDSAVSIEQEPRQRPSLDTFDKVIADEKPKDGKKKEKKGMLSGLFKRKDKTVKGGKADTDDTERHSEDSLKSPQSKESLDSENAPERRPSKLQKTPPTIVISPKQSPIDSHPPQRDFSSIASQSQQLQQQINASTDNPTPQGQSTQSAKSLMPGSQSQQPSRFPSLQEKRSVFAPITGALRSKTSSQEIGESVKPVYSKRAKERFAIDDSGSEDDSTLTAQSSILHRSLSPLENNEVNGKRPDSATRVSPIDNASPVNARPPLSQDKFNSKFSGNQQGTAEVTPTSPSDQTASTSKQSPSIPTHTPSTSRSTPTWSDASLRSYMDSDQDVRDLLMIVHDRTNITPVTSDHPLMNGLFAPEKMKLNEMQSQLDSMLMNWLSKKNQPVLTKV